MRSLIMEGFYRAKPAMNRLCLTCLCLCTAWTATAFVIPPASSFSWNVLPSKRLDVLVANAMSSSSHGSGSAAPSSTPTTTLTPETKWDFRLILDSSLKTEYAANLPSLLALNIQVSFVEEDGYEPPQGYLVQVNDVERVDHTNPTTPAVSASPILTLTKSRWKLSEDPNERKDGLWVWGLFKEPQYPFLLLQLETAALPLSMSTTIKVPATASESSEVGTPSPSAPTPVLPPLHLYAQIPHRRDRDNGQVTLSSGVPVKIRIQETLQADPFGAAHVNVYEEVSVGKLLIQPVTVKTR